jgi:hypothetical protein
MASPDNSTVPPDLSIVDDSNGIWTINPGDNFILLNGVQVGGGIGTIILWVNQHIYVLGTNNDWFLWDGSSWSDIGPNRPQPIVPPHFTAVVVSWKNIQSYINLNGIKIKFITQNLNPGLNPNNYLVVIQDN